MNWPQSCLNFPRNGIWLFKQSDFTIQGWSASQLHVKLQSVPHREHTLSSLETAILKYILGNDIMYYVTHNKTKIQGAGKKKVSYVKAGCKEIMTYLNR